MAHPAGTGQATRQVDNANLDAIPPPIASQLGLHQHADDPAGAPGAGVAGTFGSGRSPRFDAPAMGTCESVRDVHTEYARALAAGTGCVTGNYVAKISTFATPGP